MKRTIKIAALLTVVALPWRALADTDPGHALQESAVRLLR